MRLKKDKRKEGKKKDLAFLPPVSFFLISSFAKELLKDTLNHSNPGCNERGDWYEEGGKWYFVKVILPYFNHTFIL